MFRFWLFKWLAAIGLVVGFFYIPEGENFIFSRGESVVCVSKVANHLSTLCYHVCMHTVYVRMLV